MFLAIFDMPRGEKLSEKEQGQILAYHSSGLSMRAIAECLGRSKCVVNNFLRDPDSYGTISSPGRPKILDESGKRRLLREASNGKYYSKELKSMLNLPVSARRIRQLLHDTPHLQFKKRKGAPTLTATHKEARLFWARETVGWTSNWDRVIFSDEKKFNLDGPDGYQYYWSDLRKEEQVFSRRQFGGGSVMVWGSFCSSGKSSLAILEGKQNSGKYIGTLTNYLLPFAEARFGSDYIFQQDGASIHTSRQTRKWLGDQNIDVLSWPSLSPDLNPIENLWGILARKVYANGRQFKDKKSLIAAILQCWEEIDVEVLHNLISTMPKRCISVLELKGEKTKY